MRKLPEPYPIEKPVERAAAWAAMRRMSAERVLRQFASSAEREQMRRRDAGDALADDDEMRNV